MTLEELSRAVNISETTLKTQFKREQEKLEKRGIIVSKIGRGKNADYCVDYTDNFSDNRALTIFEEDKSFFLDSKMLKIADWSLLVLIGVCMLPHMVYRGSYSEFLKYVCINVSATNIENLKNALLELNNDYIGYYPDKTNSDYFVLSLYRKAEEELQVPLDRLKKCREIQIQNNNKSFIPLLKVWVATEKAIENQPYTVSDICEMTGLSVSTVKWANKELRDNVIYISQRAYDKQMGFSRGTNSYLNAFYNDPPTSSMNFSTDSCN